MKVTLWKELNDAQAEQVMGGEGELLNDKALFKNLFRLFPNGNFKLLPNGDFVGVPDGSSRADVVRNNP
jgi:hypothetical protein